MTSLDEQILEIDRNMKEWQQSFLERFKLLEQDLQSVRDAITKLKDERKALDQQREELRQKKADLSAAVERAQNDLQSLQEEEKRLADQVASIKAEISQLESNIEELEQQIAEISDKIDQQEERKNTLEQQKDELKQKIRSIEATLPQVTQDIDSKIMKVRKDLERREFMYKAMETLIKKGYASSLTEVRILQHLKYNKPMKIRELVMVAGFQQAVIDEVLEKLEASGIIEKSDPESVILKHPIPVLGIQ